MINWAFEKFWPPGDGTDHLDVAARRCCGVMFALAGLSGIIITIMNLRYLRDYTSSVTIGGLLSVMMLIVPLLLGTGTAFKSQIRITMSVLMVGIATLVMTGETLIVSPTFLLMPTLMVVALILGPVAGILAGLCAVGSVTFGFVAWHTGPDAAMNVSPDQMGALFFAILAALVCSVVGPLIYQSQMQLATERLADAVKEAEASIEAKADFLASMSHEIRTPMNGILGMSEAVLAGELPENQRASVQTIKRSGDALLTIINGILDFSKIEAGELAIEHEVFDINAVAEDVTRSLSPQAQGKHIAVEAILAPGDRRWLIGDAVRLRQILFNLMGNAVKFTDEGNVRVLVTVIPDGPLAKVQLRVEDTGIGIAEDKLDMVFDRFSQAEGSITRRFGGTGLGLTITRHLIDAMGGTISVASELGTGSEFTVDLEMPLGEAPVLAVAPSVLEKDQATAGVLVAPCRVLVADDNSVNRLVVDHLLPSDRFSKVFALGGAEAIELASASPFDVILMDISMPDVSGFAALEAIRAAEVAVGRSTPIIAFSAHAQPEERERFAAAGFDDYLAKPIDQAQLISMVEKWADPPADLTARTSQGS